MRVVQNGNQNGGNASPPSTSWVTSGWACYLSRILRLTTALIHAPIVPPTTPPVAPDTAWALTKASATRTTTTRMPTKAPIQSIFQSSPLSPASVHLFQPVHQGQPDRFAQGRLDTPTFDDPFGALGRPTGDGLTPAFLHPCPDNGQDCVDVLLNVHRRPHVPPAYVLAVNNNEPLWVATEGGSVEVAARRLAQSIPDDQWQCLSAGEGSKGPRLYDSQYGC